MNIYLDINQVLLTNKNTLALHCDEFLESIIKYPTFWLTSDYGGKVDMALSHLLPLLNHEQRNLVTLIDRVPWDLSRTEAIDFREPFLWFTRAVDEFEISDLEVQNCVKNLILIDTDKEPEILKLYAKKLPQSVQPDLTHSPYRHKFKQITS